MGKPAGVQIRRWFVVLVALLLLVGVAALAESLFILHSLRSIGEGGALPPATVAGRSEIEMAQRAAKAGAWAIVAVLVASAWPVLALCRWWKRVQDTILGL